MPTLLLEIHLENLTGPLWALGACRLRLWAGTQLVNQAQVGPVAGMLNSLSMWWLHSEILTGLWT